MTFLAFVGAVALIAFPVGLFVACAYVTKETKMWECLLAAAVIGAAITSIAAGLKLLFF